MKSVIDVCPYPNPFGDVGFSDSGGGQETGQLSPQVTTRIQCIQIRDIEPRHAWGCRALFLFLPTPVPLEAFCERLGHIYKRGVLERETCQPFGILSQCLLGLVLPVFVVQFSDLGVDSLQAYPLDVRLKHIGHYLGALSLVILPESVYEFNGIIILLKLLRKNRVRRRSLVGSEVGGDGILDTLEGTIGQVFLPHVSG
nr:hypothetical protein [uncultured Bacteroides sp.]